MSHVLSHWDKVWDRNSDDSMAEPKDGNIGVWVDEQRAAIAKLSAKDLGFELVPGWFELFSQSLAGNRDAARLNRDVLPKCDVPRLASFIVLSVSTNVDDTLIEMMGKAGRELKSGLRAAARKLVPAERADGERILKNAAFDTRRQGLAEYCFGALIMRAYLHRKSGIEPSARELAALLKAGLAASNRVAFQGTIDHDLLHRNLKNFERRRPQLSELVKQRSAEIVEGTNPA